MDRLAEDFRAGKRPALARAISMAEAGRPEVGDLLGRLLPARRRARRFGLTGPPGAGKSSLAAGIAALLRERGEDVAIVAVDPTSPFSGGALLGDRIRLNDLGVDPGVFIRSMATRGSLGGLAAATRDALDLLDAFGFANVLVETVGVGQTELEVAAAADSIAVVLVPESGDGIQAMKAGLMEIADLFVVNKADRPGADRLARDIRQAVHLKAGHAGADVPAHHGVDLSGDLRRTAGEDAEDAVEQASGADENRPEPWEPPVLKTSAGRGEGIEPLLDRLLAHRRRLKATGDLEDRRRARARAHIRDLVAARLIERAERFQASSKDLSRWVPEVAAGRATVHGAAGLLVEAILSQAEPDSSRRKRRARSNEEEAS